MALRRPRPGVVELRARSGKHLVWGTAFTLFGALSLYSGLFHGPDWEEVIGGALLLPLGLWGMRDGLRSLWRPRYRFDADGVWDWGRKPIALWGEITGVSTKGTDIWLDLRRLGEERSASIDVEDATVGVREALGALRECANSHGYDLPRDRKR